MLLLMMISQKEVTRPHSVRNTDFSGPQDMGLFLFVSLDLIHILLLNFYCCKTMRLQLQRTFESSIAAN